MKRLIGILLLTALMLGACTANGTYLPTGNGLDGATQTTARPSEAKKTEFSLVYDPDLGLNPYTCANRSNRAIFRLLYQSLFVTDSDYTVYPQLCSRYRISEDGKTYVFYLEAATFPDGTLLTANDVASSLEAARAGRVYGGRLGNVEQISLTADGGIEITLKTAYENFPLLLDIPIVRAAQVEADFPEGTGAYTLKNAASGRQLHRRQNWWCAANLAVRAEVIPLLDVQDAREIRDAFELGDVGLVCADPASDAYVDYRGDYDLWACENGVFLYLACRAKSKVFSNENVRKALTYAIDRTTLVRETYRSFGLAATLPASPNWPYYDVTLARQYAYDAQRLRDALEQEELTDSSITLLVNADDGRRVKAAQAIADMLGACSLKVTLRAYTGEAYRNALKNGSYDLHLGQTMLSPNMDLSAFFVSDGALCFGGMRNDTIATLCANALANSDNYALLYKTVMDNAMLCPVAFLCDAVYAEADLLHGLSPARDDIFFYTTGKTLRDVLQ